MPVPVKRFNIFNDNDRMALITLPHQDVCVKVGRCFCSRDGVACSIHIPPHGMVRDQDPAVLLAPDAKGKGIRAVPAKARPKASPKTRTGRSAKGGGKDNKGKSEGRKGNKKKD